MNSPLIIIGAGGHAAVVAEALLASGEEVLGFTDVDHSRHGAMLCGLPVLGDDRVLQTHSKTQVRLANGIGGINSTRIRREVQQTLELLGWRFAAVRHPTAIVSSFAHLADDVQLMAASVVQAGAALDVGCIVNTAAVIEHDVQLGAWVHVAPGAVVCGAVRIGVHGHVGAGAIVRQGLCLGDDTVIGVGAVVVKNFGGGGTLIGIPARTLGCES